MIFFDFYFDSQLNNQNTSSNLMKSRVNSESCKKKVFYGKLQEFEQKNSECKLIEIFSAESKQREVTALNLFL